MVYIFFRIPVMEKWSRFLIKWWERYIATNPLNIRQKDTHLVYTLDLLKAMDVFGALGTWPDTTFSLQHCLTILELVTWIHPDIANIFLYKACRNKLSQGSAVVLASSGTQCLLINTPPALPSESCRTSKLNKWYAASHRGLLQSISVCFLFICNNSIL